MSSSKQSSFRHIPTPTTTNDETLYGPDDATPGIVVWPSVSRTRNQTNALIQGLAHDTALTNPVTLAKCRSCVDDKRLTANSLKPDLVAECWGRGIREVAADLYAKTGVPVSVCDDEVAFKAATSRIPSATLGFEVDPEWVRPYARPFKPPKSGTSTSQYRGPTSDSLGTHGINPDGYSLINASVQTFPTNAPVPDIVINAFFNRRRGKGKERAETAIPNAACQPELVGEPGVSEIFEELSASVRDLGHLFPKGKPGKKWTLADQDVFRKEVGDTVGELSNKSKVPITVCYTEADYAQVMKQNPDLTVLRGKERDALTLHHMPPSQYAEAYSRSSVGPFSMHEQDLLKRFGHFPKDPTATEEKGLRQLGSQERETKFPSRIIKPYKAGHDYDSDPGSSKVDVDDN